MADSDGKNIQNRSNYLERGMPWTISQHCCHCHPVNAHTPSRFHERAGEHDCNGVSRELATRIVGSDGLRIAFLILATTISKKVNLINLYFFTFVASLILCWLDTPQSASSYGLFSRFD